MSGPRLQCALLAISLLATAGLPSGAAAQLGKLKKALDKGKASACVPDRSPTFIQTVGLTAAQMAAINAGLEAEIQAAPAVYEQADADQKAAEKAMKEYEKARQAYDKANEKYQACAEKVQAEESATSDKLNQKTEAASKKMKGEIDETAMQDLAQRAAVAAERVSQGKGTAEDRATMAEFQRMMAGVSAGGAEVSAAQQEAASHDGQRNARVEAACGPPPEEPAQPGDAELPGQKIKAAGAKGAKMSDSDYATARETLLALAMSNSVVKGSGGGSQQSSASGPPSGPPSDQEAEAMNQQIKGAAQKICDMKKANVPIF